MKKVKMIFKKPYLLFFICLTLLFAGCEWMGGGVISISIVPDFIEIPVGSSSTLRVVSVPAGAELGLTWESENSELAVVSQNGTVTGIKEGEVWIRAFSSEDSAVFGSSLVRVVAGETSFPDLEIRLSQTQLDLVVEEEAALEVFITPHDAPGAVIWKSDNPQVAIVSEQGVVKGKAPGVTGITVRSAANPSRYAYCVVMVNEEAGGVSVSIQPSGAKIKVGDTIALTATVANTGNQAVTWMSASPSLASVDGDGKVKGLAEGTVIIYAKSVENPQAIGIAEIIVNPKDTSPSPISITPSNVEILEEETCQLNVETQPGITSLIWESEDEIVATVDDNGLITGVSAGTTVVTAKNAANHDEKASCVVKVSAQAVSISVSVTPETIFLDIYETFQLEASVSPDWVNQSVTWESSDVSVAIVNSLGIVTVRRSGVAMITARSTVDRSKTDFCVVNVSEQIVSVTSVSVDPANATINKGDTLQLNATALPAGADQRVNWESANPQIAVVDIWGEVTGKGRGEVFITATSVENEELVGTCFLTVTDIYIDLDVTLNLHNLNMAPGEIRNLTASVTPEEIDNKKVTWASSDKHVVSVDQSGQITAVAAGTAMITVRSVVNTDCLDTCLVQVSQKELELGVGFIDQCSEDDVLWYSFTAAVGSRYKIAWMDKNSGLYTGDIAVSAYHADRTTPYFASQESGPGIIESTRCERVYLKVEETESPGSFSLGYSLDNQTPPETWTLMIYANGNNLEECVVGNLKEMLSGYHKDIGINLVLLLDKYSTYDYDVPALATDGCGLFTIGPRELNKIHNGRRYFGLEENEAFELNMGDATVLRRFIEFSKANFPAEKYGLIFMAHGQGTGGFSADDLVAADRLHPGEISAKLSAKHSVDLIGFNSCLMGNAEVAYQFRKDPGNTGFSADIMLAPPTMTNEEGWNYLDALQRISVTQGGTVTTEEETVSGNMESIYDPAQLSAEEMALIFLEEHRDGMYNYSLDFARVDTLNCYDLSRITAVKESLDQLAVSLAAGSSWSYEGDVRTENGEMRALEEVRDNDQLTLRYFRTNLPTEELKNKERTYYPFYDIKSFCEGITLDRQNFSDATRLLAAEVVENIKETILYSYYGDYVSYTDMYGLSVFFSNGDKFYLDQEMFRNQWWYNANNTSSVTSSEKYYGELAWCIDRATDQEDIVDNWFELLDYWYDPEGNDTGGGSNGYRY